MWDRKHPAVRGIIGAGSPQIPNPQKRYTVASLSSKRKTSVNRRLKMRDHHVKAAPVAVAAAIVFNEHLYSQLKTRFASAVAMTCEDGADVRQVMRVLVQQEFDDGGRDGALQMQPYIVKYVAAYRDQLSHSAASPG